MSLRLRFRAVALVAAAAGGALAVLILPAAPASAATVDATLTLHGVSWSGSVNAGDSVTFSAGSDTVGHTVTLHAGSFPGGHDVALAYGGKTYTVSFPGAGTYPFSWTTSLLGIGHTMTQQASVQVAGPPTSPPPSSSPPASSPPPGSSSAPGPTPSSSVGGFILMKTLLSPALTGAAIIATYLLFRALMRREGVRIRWQPSTV